MDYLELVKTIVGKLVKIIEYLLSRTKKSKKEKEKEKEPESEESEQEKSFKKPELINKENINEYMEKVIKEIENEPDSDKNLEKEKEFFGSKISDVDYKISSDSSL